MTSHARCTACRVLVPVAKQVSTKWALASVGGGVGGGVTKSLGGAVLGAGIAFGVGWLIDQLTAPLCGSCGAPVAA